MTGVGSSDRMTLQKETKMERRFKVRWIDVMVIAAIVMYAGIARWGRPAPDGVGTPTFAREVNLEPLNTVGAHADGRLRSFESHARTYMGYVSGRREIRGQSNGFSYLDLLFRPQQYVDVDTIYVKNKNVLAEILGVLEGHAEVDERRAARILGSGLISRNLLLKPDVIALLQKFGQDLIRTAKTVDQIQSALTVSDSRFLLENLRLVAPPSGKVNEVWLSMTDILSGGGAPMDQAHAGVATARPIPGLDETVRNSLREVWNSMAAAWRVEDAVAVNQHLARLAELVPTVSPHLYPSQGRLAMESRYFRSKSMTWVWLIYLAAVVPLLMSVIYKWSWARRIGMTFFVIAFLFHTASLGVRWYISGRWPNANMFEAVTTAAWFGGVGAIVLERLVRRTPFKDLFALGSAVVSMAALMAAYFLPADLDSSISNKMAALNDIWLYIHTNVIIWSYAVIGLACIPALLLLRHRWCLAWDQRLIPRVRLMILPIAVAVLNYAAYRLTMHVMDDPARELTGNAFIGVAGAFWGSLMIVLLELMAIKTRRERGARSFERGASGGASALMGAGVSGGTFLTQEKPTATQIFDGATMVLVELSFVMLWTGVVMGAIWADHSWGRPWGWDPKEVFALNTFIIFLVLIHVRLKVKDKAFWTAVLAVVGFEVMMFNWIVVNFVISGLHSYA